ncbi:sensor histidine kinase [Nocardia brasiliensis]|uniref:sensor histidine kinase n=1 Tax=Nocardia brasiliensis TaxID=37326 RepID=UPI0024537619|nr:ATP-binding protein [Nocardia brasiliensis]
MTTVGAGAPRQGESSSPPGHGFQEPTLDVPAYSALVGCVVVCTGFILSVLLLPPGACRVALGIGCGVVVIMLSAAVAAAVHFRARAVLAGQALKIAEQAAAVRVEAACDTAATYAAQMKRSDQRRAAAMVAFAGAASRMQAMTTSMLAELRAMEERHADPRILADLLLLDHRTAQSGRLADSIAVLSGARSGRRWAKPIAMESILRGAMGRVAGYQRVRLRGIADVAIAGHAAEGVMHALAELLDNACNFSPPTTEVHVYATEVPAGVVVTVEDSGLVMSESALRRAASAVSRVGGRSSVDLSSLTGTRLGLAVVGFLAQKHNLTVSYRPSAIGGTAVVVVVPRELIVRIDRAPAPDGPPPVAQQSQIVAVSADSSLPKRDRGKTLAAAHPRGLGSAPGSPADSAAPRPSALGAFQRALSSTDTEGGAETGPSDSPEQG